ncbi:MAG TPA: glycosyltransferase family A protein [Hyphomicrobiaceae bacterium]|nr:glycosyltransferase family A protein [Hyphomicrobiaceae bacterium]
MKPLVTAIMPTTAARRRFIPGAAACFLAQSYESKELIIVGEPEDGVSDLLPVSPQIKFITASGLIGHKRNVACTFAAGDLIAHWDDDDWSAPERLAVQAETLALAPDAVLTGFRSLLFYDERDGAVWKYRGRIGYAPGTTFCYRREFWTAHNFRDVQVQEDNFFLDCARSQLAIRERSDLMVALIHDGSTAPKLGSVQWSPQPLDALPGRFPLEGRDKQ